MPACEIPSVTLSLVHAPHPLVGDERATHGYVRAFGLRRSAGSANRLEIALVAKPGARHAAAAGDQLAGRRSRGSPSWTRLPAGIRAIDRNPRDTALACPPAQGILERPVSVDHHVMAR
jgi:hypothetical protein